MADWKTAQAPFKIIPVVNKTISNEGDKLATITNPVWKDAGQGNKPITPTHTPCGYWHKDYVPTPSPPPPPSESIIIGGGFYTCNSVLTYRMAKLDDTGILDESFLPYPNSYVYDMLIRDDGKIWIGGAFTKLTVNEVSRYRLARINSDGSLDEDFNVIVSNFVEKVILQTDGKLIIVGGFVTVGGITRNAIARFNLDDTVDIDFNPNANETVRTVAIQSDDKIIISGNFDTVGGVAKQHIARLEVTGAIDTSFNTILGAGENTYASAIVTLSNGDIILGGGFTNINGVDRTYIVRLFSDGTLDTSFNLYLDAGVSEIIVLDSGEFIISGMFTTVNGVTRNHIAKFSSEWVLDTDFNPNINYSSVTVVEMANNKLVVGGAFTDIDGVALNRLAILNVDGTVDATFTPNIDSTVYSIGLVID